MSFYFASEEIASQKKVAIFFFYYVFDSQGFSALEEVIEWKYKHSGFFFF